jgi:hypothetical protein
LAKFPSRLAPIFEQLVSNAVSARNCIGQE